ncbi:MAG: HAD hydrolase family protein [Patescibacteria group bacterium]
MDAALKAKFAKIKLLATDFDGVMTDGFLYVDENGKESVRCSRKDGLGIELLKKNGLMVGVLSKEKNFVVAARCQKLNIPVWQGIESGEGKLEILRRIVAENNLSQSEVAYIGDDINDLLCLKYAGLALTVADGHPLVKASANYVSKANGGQHAVREIAEMILMAKDAKLDV